MMKVQKDTLTTKIRVKEIKDTKRETRNKIHIQQEISKVPKLSSKKSANTLLTHSLGAC